MSFHARLKRSTVSRSSSTRSFVDRSLSKKEILSPFYKPFEIFFACRRKSPYASHRSTVMSAQKRPASRNKGEAREAVNSHYFVQNVDRSATPSFAIGAIENVPRFLPQDRIVVQERKSKTASRNSYEGQRSVERLNP